MIKISGSEGFPGQAESLPVRLECRPVAVEGFPLEVERRPVRLESVPEEMDGRPVRVDGFPKEVFYKKFCGEIKLIYIN